MATDDAQEFADEEEVQEFMDGLITKARQQRAKNRRKVLVEAGIRTYSHLIGTRYQADDPSVKESRSEMAGLMFPVGRVHRYLKRGHYAQRISVKASVYLTSVLEYVTAELGMELETQGKKRINPRHLQLAIRDDEDLNKLLRSVIVPAGGVAPHIHPELLPKSQPRQPSTSE
ncbi:Histone H2A [Mycena sanguinolenta]|uniref:Histone H2A n=1 Tax=Mycena sanguinolenta TaxID=230812 RepID=A0A8H6YAE8_9AGAR|nr:Histone H2A [Mycena sanguinolenta]